MDGFRGETHHRKCGRAAAVGAHLDKESGSVAVGLEGALVGVGGGADELLLHQGRADVSGFNWERVCGGGGGAAGGGGEDVLVVGLEVPDDHNEGEGEQCDEDGLGLEAEEDLGGDGGGGRRSVLPHCTDAGIEVSIDHCSALSAQR